MSVSLPEGRSVVVRGADGTRLHTEVFGPADGYPIVLSHGIVCAMGVWREQIVDLARDYRVIAYDHRGHGRSGVPARGHYTLNHLASDLDAVLNATLAPGERAVIAGHSMGGIAIQAWSERYRRRVSQRADAVALINTTSGDIVRQVQLMTMPQVLTAGRAAVATRVIRRFGGVPAVRPAERAGRRLVATVAVGPDAGPDVTDFVYRLFVSTSRAGRGGCAAMLVDAMDHRHLALDGLTAPTLVIGSRADRLLPIAASRRIAASLPNLVDLVELPGGHCSILERPTEVNRQLRVLAETVSGAAKISS